MGSRVDQESGRLMRLGESLDFIACLIPWLAE
jgi:hypothetical protein